MSKLLPETGPVVVRLPPVNEQPDPHATVPSTERFECMKTVLYGGPGLGKGAITRFPACSLLVLPVEITNQFRSPAIPPRKASDRERWQIRWVSGIATAAVVYLLWWYSPLPPPQVTRIDHLTSARIDTPVKLVSDGARLYYMERDGDHWNLMETAVSGGEGQRVETGATSALAMDVSPDFSELL